MIQNATRISLSATPLFENRARSAATTASAVDGTGTPASSGAGTTPGTDALTPDQQREVEQLKQTDRKVRQHEAAHMAAGGGLVLSAPTYSYQTGPDNQRYAVGGEVSIDASPAQTPEATIRKAQQIRAAALAPADPSAQDQSVAAQAGRMENEARIEMARTPTAAVSSADRGVSLAQSSESSAVRFYRNASETNQLGGKLDFFA